jgi:hypothetical protein
MLLLPLKRVLCLFSWTACGYLFLYRIAVVVVNEIRYLAIEIKMSMTSVTPPALWCPFMYAAGYQKLQLVTKKVSG